MRMPKWERFKGSYDTLSYITRRCILVSAAGVAVLQCDDGADACRALDAFAARCRAGSARHWFEGLQVYVENYVQAPRRP